jgi:hypothetical protein
MLTRCRKGSYYAEGEEMVLKDVFRLWPTRSRASVLTDRKGNVVGLLKCR